MSGDTGDRGGTGGRRSGRRRVPLALRVVIGVALGSILGVVFGREPWLGGYGNEELGVLGMLVIRLLKALATPLILVAVLDSFLTTRITARTGWRFLGICLVNISIAMTIGLTILNMFEPGASWRGRLDDISTHLAAPEAVAGRPAAPPPGATLDPVRNISAYVPESVVKPLLENSVISLVLLAILAGAAMRRVKDRALAPDGMLAIERFVGALFQVLTVMLLWVAEAVPFAVFAIVAQVVGRAGLDVFGILWLFLVTILAGLLIHTLVYYPVAAWLVGRKAPREYLGKGADAILTGLSCNSSLATVPITLRCLKDMRVSDASARMSACIGTNLNNDGIILYEAMATIFLCQAFGYDLSVGNQVTIVLASIMAGVGIAGIPDAGLIVLPLVLAAAGLPEATVAAAIPLIVPVDWIIARVRSGVNVMCDMLVAILLDRGEPA